MSNGVKRGEAWRTWSSLYGTASASRTWPSRRLLRGFTTSTCERRCWPRSLGYHSYYIIEHQNSHVGQNTAPSVYLSAVAQRTSKLRIGVMIYQLPFYNPIRLAQEAAMLDQLSHGRLEFGTGIGVAEHEFIRWNLPFFERQKMASEALEIIVKAWTQEDVTHNGEYWQYDEALPVPKPFSATSPADLGGRP